MTTAMITAMTMSAIAQPGRPFFLPPPFFELPAAAVVELNEVVVAASVAAVVVLAVDLEKRN